MKIPQKKIVKIECQLVTPFPTSKTFLVYYIPFSLTATVLTIEININAINYERPNSKNNKRRKDVTIGPVMILTVININDGKIRFGTSSRR